MTQKNNIKSFLIVVFLLFCSKVYCQEIRNEGLDMGCSFFVITVDETVFLEYQEINSGLFYVLNKDTIRVSSVFGEFWMNKEFCNSINEDIVFLLKKNEEYFVLKIPAYFLCSGAVVCDVDRRKKCRTPNKDSYSVQIFNNSEQIYYESKNGAKID